MKTEFPWKQRFLRTPEKLRTKLDGFAEDQIVVGCVRKFSKTELQNRILKHLGITAGTDGIVTPSAIVPAREVGRASEENLDGREIIRRDLPKVWKTYTIEAPNWGHYGYHDVDIDREVYQRDFISPREFAIRVTIVGQEPGPDPRYVFQFTIDTVLDRTADDFERELLFAVNLLQENVGAADVFPADADLTDYMTTVYVDWEILPAGERDANIARILSGIRGASEQQRKALIGRYDFLAKLKPVNFIKGTSGFRRYFGAQFGDELVAFENVEYGNALYVMFGNWEELSHRSRLDLLSGDRTGFVRIIHDNGWKDKLTRVMNERRPR